MSAAVTPPEITIQVVRSDRQYARILDLRARARSLADGAVGTAHDERYDQQPNAVLLLAESVHDGEALGTLRILAGDRGPLTIEEHIELPPALGHRSLAEASRLAVRRGPGAGHVRRMLWKAWYRYSRIAQLRVMLACVPQELVHSCERLGMIDATPAPAAGRARYRRDAGERRLMQIDVAGVRDWMQQHGHPLSNFFLHEPHPEIDLIGLSGQAVPSARSGAGARRLPLPATAPVAGLAVV